MQRPTGPSRNPDSGLYGHAIGKITGLLPILCGLALTGCVATGQESQGIKPLYTYPVTTNETPYSRCLKDLASIKGNNLPVFSVGEVADKTGQINYDENGHVVSQGISEMTVSALYKTGKVNLVERLDLRIPLAEVKLAEQGRLNRDISVFKDLPASDFVVVGALTELNYNIASGGARLSVKGIGGGVRTVVINVALDMRVIDAKNFAVRYVSTLQKQIYGFEVEANVFRFFGNTLVELEAGSVRNEPLQLGVRSVVEMGVYQIMTDFLGLPSSKSCTLVETGHFDGHLQRLSPKTNGEE